MEFIACVIVIEMEMEIAPSTTFYSLQMIAIPNLTSLATFTNIYFIFNFLNNLCPH